MQGEGISLVGSGLPFGYVGGMTPSKIPFAGADGRLRENPGVYLTFDELGNTVILPDTTIYGVTNLYGNTWAATMFLNYRLLFYAIFPTAVTPYNVTNDSIIILVTTGAGAFIVNLQTAVGQLGRYLIIKKVDAGVGQVTIDAAGAETIDGALTRVLAAQWNSVTIVSDGANWQIVATT